MVILKCKSKALSKTRTQAESKLVVDEYKFLQDKINEILDYSAVLLQLDREDNALSHSQSSHSLNPMKGSAVLSRHSGREDQVVPEPKMAKRTSK